jgi:hypothetical protein
LNDQETREEVGTPIDNTVSSVFSFLSLKDNTFGIRDVRSLLNVGKQLASEEIREVKVTWVDSNPDPSVTNT